MLNPAYSTLRGNLWARLNSAWMLLLLRELLHLVSLQMESEMRSQIINKMVQFLGKRRETSVLSLQSWERSWSAIQKHCSSKHLCSVEPASTIISFFYSFMFWTKNKEFRLLACANKWKSQIKINKGYYSDGISISHVWQARGICTVKDPVFGGGWHKKTNKQSSVFP